jgi:hypothetical protein
MTHTNHTLSLAVQARISDGVVASYVRDISQSALPVRSASTETRKPSRREARGLPEA